MEPITPGVTSITLQWNVLMPFTIVSADPIPVVRQRLKSALTTVASGWDYEPTFHGEITDTGFRIIRNRPRKKRGEVHLVAIGRFIMNDDRTIIEIKMRRPENIGENIRLALAIWGSIGFIIFPFLATQFSWVLMAFCDGCVAFWWLCFFGAWVYERRLYRQGISRIVAEQYSPY
jgi:hypothetical protein